MKRVETGRHRINLTTATQVLGHLRCLQLYLEGSCVEYDPHIDHDRESYGNDICSETYARMLKVYREECMVRI